MLQFIMTTYEEEYVKKRLKLNDTSYSIPSLEADAISAIEFIRYFDNLIDNEEEISERIIKLYIDYKGIYWYYDLFLCDTYENYREVSVYVHRKVISDKVLDIEYKRLKYILRFTSREKELFEFIKSNILVIMYMARAENPIKYIPRVNLIKNVTNVYFDELKSINFGHYDSIHSTVLKNAYEYVVYEFYNNVRVLSV